jgi:hypothetical protein
MGSIAEAIAVLVAKLKEVGFQADVDPALLHVSPNGVWVQPREVRDYTLGGGATLVCWLYLIVGNLETENALAQLDDLLAGVLALVDPSSFDNVVDLTAAVLLPASPSTPLPAYRVAVDLDL